MCALWLCNCYEEILKYGSSKSMQIPRLKNLYLLRFQFIPNFQRLFYFIIVYWHIYNFRHYYANFSMLMRKLYTVNLSVNKNYLSPVVCALKIMEIIKIECFTITATSTYWGHGKKQLTNILAKTKFKYYERKISSDSIINLIYQCVLLNHNHFSVSEPRPHILTPFI